MRETAYNLFVLISDDGLVRSFGVVAHALSGSDEAKNCSLQEAVDDDIPGARIFPVPTRFVTVLNPGGQTVNIEGAFTFDLYRELLESGDHLDLFEELFDAVGAPPDPLVCITPVLRGVAVIDGVRRFGMGELV